MADGGADIAGATVELPEFSGPEPAGAVSGSAPTPLADENSFATMKTTPAINRSGKSATIGGIFGFSFIVLYRIADWRLVILGKLPKLCSVVKFVDGFLGEIKAAADINSLEPTFFPPAPNRAGRNAYLFAP